MNESMATGFPPPPMSDAATEVMNTVNLFSEIEREGVVSQESLAIRLGVAVGLTNAYIKRCVRKGLIKMQKVPARRYAYFLTPKGFSEKTRLTREYLSHSFSFFRRARSQCQNLMVEAEQQGWRRILLVGEGELAEVAVLSALEVPNITLVGIVALGRNVEHIVGLPAFCSFSGAPEFDAVIVTDTAAPLETYLRLMKLLPDERILLAPLLHIVRPKDRRKIA